MQRPLGILSLDTNFPRIPGDAGAPESYPFACQVAVVSGADSPVIVQDHPPPPDLLDRFVTAARRLEADGAGAIVSTCGFLVTAQAEIARAVQVPVMLSALSLYPVVQQILPGRIGILTASAMSLGPRSLAAAGIDRGDVSIAGMDGHALFAETFLAGRAAQRRAFDRGAMAALVLEEARRLMTASTPPAALILECGNLPPYADDIRAATGVPVFSIIDAANWMMAAQGK